MRLRPSTADDQAAVLRLLAERDRADFGEPGFTEPLVVDQWRSREFNPTVDAVVAEDQAGVIGYAAVFHPGDLVFVHPGREDEGIGTELLRWAQERARTRGIWRQRVAAGNSRGCAFLEAAGYRCERSVHTLAWTAQTPLPAASLPPGISLDPIRADHDAAELHELDAAVFAQSPDYSPETLDQFTDEHLASPDLHPPSTTIARHHGTPAGFVICRLVGSMGGIDLLGVVGEHRRHGLGRALLSQAFSALARDGAEEVRLDVASDNPGALRLYRSVGMVDRHEVLVYERAAG